MPGDVMTAKGDAMAKRDGQGRKRYRQRTKRPAVPVVSTSVLFTCACGKQAYASRRSAKQVSRVAFPGQAMRAYRCEEGEGDAAVYHLTSLSTSRVTESRSYFQGGTS